MRHSTYCKACGEYWPCYDSQRKDIRPELRALHVAADPKDEEPEPWEPSRGDPDHERFGSDLGL